MGDSKYRKLIQIYILWGDFVKSKLSLLVLAVVVILGIGVIKRYSELPNKATMPDIPIQSVGYGQQLDLMVIKDVTELNRGDTGSITIQGQPLSKYIIKSSYVRGTTIFNANKQITTDANGIGTFTWIVSKETEPGVYPIIISGNGRTLHLRQTILAR